MRFNVNNLLRYINEENCLILFVTSAHFNFFLTINMYNNCVYFKEIVEALDYDVIWQQAFEAYKKSQVSQ